VRRRTVIACASAYALRVALDQPTGASNMGKYFLGWIMGVPVIVLVIVYIIFN
jgi:hypothetical protein